MLVHARTHQFMVNMVLVSIEKGLVVDKPVDSYSHHIGHGYEEQGDGYQQGIRTGRPDGGVVRGALDGEESQDES